MDNEASLASAVLLVIAGVWLLLQTLVGDLPGRILSWKPSPTNIPNLSSSTGKGGGFSGGGTGTSGGGGGGSAGAY